MDISLNGGNAPLNKRLPSAERWALRDLAARDRRNWGALDAADDSRGAGPENPSRSRREPGGAYAYR